MLICYFLSPLLLQVTSPLSLFMLIILVLIIFALTIAVGFLVIVILRRKHKGSENMNDDVLKEEAQSKFTINFSILNF